MRNHSVLALVLLVLQIGCYTDRKAALPTDAERASPPTNFAPEALQPIDLTYGIHLARLETHITVTSNGFLRSVRTENKKYGPNDNVVEDVTVREGHLTPAEMHELADLFADWKSLSSTTYGGVADGLEITVRYGSDTVSGGSEIPKQVWSILDRLSELSGRMQIRRQ